MGEFIRLSSSGGAEQFRARLRERIGRGTRMGDALGAVGHRLALTTVPLSIRRNEAGAPTPRRGGKPLLDTGRLASSIAYRATQRDLVVGTSVPYARILNRGGVIRPRFAKRLLLPQSPPLSRSEARAFPQGKASIRARYPGSFYIHGPAGEGVYRKTSFRRTRSIELIARAVDHVTARRNLWLIWRQAWLQDSLNTVGRWYRTGSIPGGAKPATGGTPDVGKR